MMKILDVNQGTDKWIELRLEFKCASEAPAVVGESKFMTRNQLLALKKGWKSNPHGSFKQKLFDDGHEKEDMARSVLEIERCEDLPAVVGTVEIDGMTFLSSFDMFPRFGNVIEHKLWNETLAENVRNCVIEPHYYWQLEHQMVTAEIDSIEFVVSNGTSEKMISMIYDSVPKRRADLIAAWKQFEIDLDGYEVEAKKETVVAVKQNAFPTIECTVEGSKVISNLGSYIPTIQALAEGQMSIILESDQDFANKEEFNKTVKLGRASLKSEASKIETAFESLAEFNVYVKQADSILQKLQSHGERQVKEAKEIKKRTIKLDAEKEISDHLDGLSKTIKGVKITGIAADWDKVIKGKRNFEKMQDAIDSEIANLKIQANEKAGIILINLNTFTELASDHKFLFSDYNELILKDNEDLVNLIKMRISDHEKAEELRLENERKRIQAEEEAKAKREADRKLELDRKRIREEEQEKARQAQAEKVKEQIVETPKKSVKKQPEIKVNNARQDPAKEEKVLFGFMSNRLADKLISWSGKNGLSLAAIRELDTILKNNK